MKQRETEGEIVRKRKNQEERESGKKERSSDAHSESIYLFVFRSSFFSLPLFPYLKPDLCVQLYVSLSASSSLSLFLSISLSLYLSISLTLTLSLSFLLSRFFFLLCLSSFTFDTFKIFFCLCLCKFIT